MEELFNNEFTHTTTNESLPDFDLQVIKKMADEIDTAKILRELAFSKEPCELKKKYYDAIDRLPKKEANNIGEMFGGIRIVEDENLPENVMVWRYNNPIHNEIFIWKDGKLYKMGGMMDFINRDSHFSL